MKEAFGKDREEAIPDNTCLYSWALKLSMRVPKRSKMTALIFGNCITHLQAV